MIMNKPCPTYYNHSALRSFAPLSEWRIQIQLYLHCTGSNNKNDNNNNNNNNNKMS